MKLALITDVALATSHGTGNLLLRLLDGAPLSVTSFYPGPVTTSPPVPSFAARRARTVDGAMHAVRRRLPAVVRPAGPSDGSARYWRYSLDAAGAASLREADVILAVVHTAEGLRFVHDLVASVPGDRAVVLWFMDLLISPGELGNTSRDLPVFDRAGIWAFNTRIRASLQELFPARRHEIALNMFLGVPVPATLSRVARALSADTRGVMIGNVWDTSVWPLLDDIWNRACAIHGFDLELSWYGPAAALARVQQAGIRLDRRIRYRGHADDLNAVLGAADVAVVAFAPPGASSLFSRHSFPSRVADFAANGLPLFALCGHDTALAEYLASSGAGLYDTGEDVERAAQGCAQFLADTALRERCGRQARRYAEDHFDLDQQRGQFVAALEQMAHPGP